MDNNNFYSTVIQSIEEGTYLDADSLEFQYSAWVEKQFSDVKNQVKEIDSKVEEIKTQDKTQALNAVSLIEDMHIELFHNQFSKPYAKILMKDNKYQIIPILSNEFKVWLNYRYSKTYGQLINDTSLRTAVANITGIALYDRSEHYLNNRICFHDNSIYYDLGNWTSVRINENGWDIVNDPPILFRKYSHQLSHNIVKRPGNFNKIFEIVNIKDEHKLLFAVYLISCFIPDIPHLIAIIHGEKGSTKTSMMRVCRMLVDPSLTQVLTIKNDEDGLAQQLMHHYFAPYDNIRYLSQWQSDMLCRAVTGDGNTKRQLYSDDDDIIYNYKRCICLTGINVTASQPDLLDRSIILRLDQVPKGKRISEEKFWALFETLKEDILTGIFDIISIAMRIKPSIELKELPRMADIAIWGCAITEAMGYSKDEFIQSYKDNYEIQNMESIESTPIGELIIEYVDSLKDISGKDYHYKDCMSQFYGDLKQLANLKGINTKTKKWPKDAKALSRKINEIKGNLRHIGIEIDTTMTMNCNQIIVKRSPNRSVKQIVEKSSPNLWEDDNTWDYN